LDKDTAGLQCPPETPRGAGTAGFKDPFHTLNIFPFKHKWPLWAEWSCGLQRAQGSMGKASCKFTAHRDIAKDVAG
jgi:hypothetical protein